MENEFSRLVDALPGLVWTDFPTSTSSFLVNDDANTKASALSYCQQRLQGRDRKG